MFKLTLVKYNTRAIGRLYSYTSLSYLIHMYNDLFPTLGRIQPKRSINYLLFLQFPFIPFTAAFITSSLSGPVSNEFLSSCTTLPPPDSFFSLVRVDMPILWFFSRHWLLLRIDFPLYRGIEIFLKSFAQPRDIMLIQRVSKPHKW